MIESVLRKLLSKYENKIRLEVWGTPLPDGLRELKDVFWHPAPTNVYTNFVKYFQTLNFDLVIAPLADNLFNRCKSALKFLEYSAIGAPGVYSRIYPYEAVIIDGVNGYLASTEEEWLSKLTILLENPDQRLNIARAAQQTIREKWLLSSNIRSWHDIFNRLNREISLEDPKKPMRAHIANTINRQLFNDRKNESARHRNLENELSLLTQSLTQQLHQKDVDFTALSVKQEEEFNERYKQIEQQVQSLTQQQDLVIKTLEESGDRVRQLINTNEDLNAQLQYWSSQASFLHNEKQTLTNNIQERDRTLNDIYNSRAWKMLTGYRERRAKLSRETVKLRTGAGVIKRIIPGIISSQKAQLKDSGLFNIEYYLRLNPDVLNAGVDPILHYLRFGGVEGRDPSPDFDSSWYLDTNPDVKIAGVNPLLHYLTHGKKEGRQICAVGENSKLADNLNLPVKNLEFTEKLVPAYVRLAPQLLTFLKDNLKQTYELSISHDDYLSITGGSQVYIADEQRQANQAAFSYLHVYPFRKGKTLVPDEAMLYLGINLDGKHIADTEADELINALTNLEGKMLEQVTIHHSMGLNAKFLKDALRLSKKSVFWLHDYFSLCPSYNLLRNDVEYCGAPDINSNACRLCSYGNARLLQTPTFYQLFNENNLEVASPSRFTYELWQSRFPVLAPVKVIPPAILRWKKNFPTRYKGGVLRVGFLGYPLDFKGWSTWLNLVNNFTGNNYYKFFHFSTQQGEKGNYNRIETRVTKENRLAMVESLRWNQIDAVVLWSTVAETFSFTMHEALAAGCFILTNPKSGNIQDYVNRNPERGLVLENEEALIELFETGMIVKKVEEYQKNGRPEADLIFGTLEEIEA